jgi:hypothetical protein
MVMMPPDQISSPFSKFSPSGMGCEEGSSITMGLGSEILVFLPKAGSRVSREMIAMNQSCEGELTAGQGDMSRC